jgi:hypothetical protein
MSDQEEQPELSQTQTQPKKHRVKPQQVEDEEQEAPKPKHRSKRPMAEDEPEDQAEKVPVQALHKNPNFGEFAKQTHKVGLLVGDHECALTIEYVPADFCIDVGALRAYLFKTASQATDLHKYINGLHRVLQHALKGPTLNIKLDAKSGENIVLTTAKRMSSKKKKAQLVEAQEED